MGTYCPYCHNAKSFTFGDVYCSNHGPKMQDLDSGVFLIDLPELSSDEHFSRLSIRWVVEGSQYYEVGGRPMRLSPDRYLIINEGQRYRTNFKSIIPNRTVEMLGIAFRPDLASNLYRTLTETQESLLDDPYKPNAEPFYFFENTCEMDPVMLGHLKFMRDSVAEGKKDGIDLDLVYGRLMQQMLGHHKNLFKRIRNLDVVKRSTQVELWRRVSTARDYIEAFLHTPLQLEEISRSACLSPYHFLRIFKYIYGLTPHRYLTQRRLERARLLLKVSSLPVNQICVEVGFEDPSSFGRLFKRQVGVTPAAYRKQWKIAS